MQNPININANPTGLQLRNGVNVALQTIASDFLGSSIPSPTYAGQSWIDTSGANPVLKKMSAGNSTWITLGTFVNNVFQPANALLSNDTSITKQSNTFNGANQLVKLDANAKLPAIDGSALTNVSAIPNLTFGCVNSGPSTDGTVLSFSSQTITLAVGTVLTYSNGVKVTVPTGITYTNAATTTGTYFLFYYNGGLVMVNNFYVQSIRPNPTGTAVWFNTMNEPFSAQYYNGSVWTAVYPCAFVGAYVVAASVLNSLIQPKFNINFYNTKEQDVYDFGTVSTGSIVLKNSRYQKVIPAATLAINLPTDIPKGIVVSLELKLTNGATVYTITQPASIKWRWLSTPALTAASTTYTIVYWTDDGGITWYGTWAQEGT